MMISHLLLASVVWSAPTKGVDFDYNCEGKPMQGYVAAPSDNDALRPAVLIVHDWNGIDAYEKGRADQLAALGYVAFCIDIYGKGVRPKTAQECATEAGKYYADNALLVNRARAGLEALAKLDDVNKNPAAIGYCFGGKTVLEMARAGFPLSGVVSFHGSLGTQSPLKPGGFNGSVLVLHGEADPLVPQKDIDSLKSEMKSAAVDFKFVAYPGAVHSFTVPSPDGGSAAAKYDKNADEGSWKEMITLFKRVLK